jgi:hypothetical protein
MGLGGLLEFFCNLTAFLPEYYCSINKNKIIILLFAGFMEKKKIKGLDGVVVDSGKNCVAHDTIYAILVALFCLVNFAYCNYFAIHGFESPVKLSIHCISYFKHCSHRYPQEHYFRKGYLNLG